MDKIKFILIFITLISTLVANEKISVQLLWKHQFEFAGFYMAKEKGFYKDVGLDVTLKEYKFGIDITKDVEDGTSTYGLNYPSVIMDYTNGAKVVLLNAILQSSPHVLVSTKSKIDSIKEFKNKNIMIFDNAIKSVTIKSMLNSNGVTIKDLNRIKSEFSLDKLLEGSVDLKAVYLSNEVYQLQQKGINYKIWDPKDYGFDFYDNILFTSQNEAQNNPERVKKFQEASLKGWKYAFDNIDETVNIILKNYNTQNKTSDAYRYEAKVLKALAFYKTDKIGTLDINKIQRIFDIYNLMGLTKQKLDLDNLVFHYSGDKLEFSTKELEYLKNKKFISMCVDPDWMPFEKIENHKHKGIAADYFNKFNAQLPIPIKLIETKDWLESIEYAKQRKCDIFSLAMKTPQRDVYMNFTQPYLKVPMVIATKKGEKYIKNIEHLDGKKIAIIKGYASADLLKGKYLGISFVEVETLDEALQKVLTSEVYGVIENLAVISKKIDKDYVGMIQITKKLSDNFELGIATRNDQPILNSIFKKLVFNLDDETHVDILKKWLPVSILEYDEKSMVVNLTKEQKEYLQNKKTIKMCNNQTWAPIEFSTKLYDNKPLGKKHHDMQGISIDTLHLLEERLKVKFEHVHTSTWKESQEYLKKGLCDILPAASITKDRLNYAVFTKPYLSYDLAILTKTGHPIVYGLDELTDKTMSRKKGSGLIQMVKQKYPKIDIRETDDTKTSFMNVSNGKADYTISTLPVASYYLNKLAINNLQISGYLEQKFELAIAVKKDEAILRDILQAALLTISWNEHKHINDKWTKNILKEVVNTKYIWQAIAVIVIIIIFLLFRQYTLSKYNKKLRKTKIELESSLSEIQHILDTTIEAIVILKDGKCVDVNQATLELFKLKSKKDILGKVGLEFIAEESKQAVIDTFDLDKTKPYEVDAIKSDGTKFPILIRAQNFVTLDKKLRIIAMLDLSELKQRDRLIADQAKMVALGEMIGNIAHQWRQPLSIISVAASGIKLKNELGVLDSQEIIRSAEGIVKSTKYLSQTIDDFRDFIKGNKNPVEFKINENMTKNLSLLEGMLKTNDIEVVLDLGSDTTVTNFENELTQAVINIINNAKDALNSELIEHKLIFIETYQKNNYGVISIKDNANGIKKDLMNKIFEPYFTTKHKSQGTGLGLFMTHKIITESMKGDITVKNDKFTYKNTTYYGANFEIFLPIKKG